MKKLIVCLMIVGLVVTGCTGSFNITKKLYDVHRSQENKWIDELIFLAFAIIPIYGLGMLGDAVIFNTIEFWSGKNPITVSMGDSPDQDVILERSAMGVVAKDRSGAVRYTAIKDPAGSVSVYDGKDNLVRYFPAEEVASGREQYAMN